MRSVGSPVERGFSMVELLVAMTATLVVTGAIYGLVVAGNSAFRREPALADRQQNIRMAMDIISQDLFRAGYGMPSFAQAFTDGLDGVGQMGSGGKETDELEIFRAGDCPALTVCEPASLAGKSITTRERFGSCYQMPATVLMGNETEWDLRWAEKPGLQGEVGQSCDGKTADTENRHGHANFPVGQAPVLNPTSSFTNWDSPPTYMMLGMAIRYRIAPDPVDGVPNLERSTAGGEVDLDGNSTWQIIARGIEDLQVEYMNAAGWQSTPGTIDCVDEKGCTAPAQGDYDRLIRRVRVRLSARAVENNLAGQRTSAVGNAVRGDLSTEIAPRATNTALQMAAGVL